MGMEPFEELEIRIFAEISVSKLKFSNMRAGIVCGKEKESESGIEVVEVERYSGMSLTQTSPLIV